MRRELKLNFPVLGSKLGPAMKDVSKSAREGSWELGAGGRLRIAGHDLEPGEYDLQYVGREGRSAAQDHNLLVVLDTVLTPELRLEGFAREVVRSVQDMRKQAGYNVEDRIVLCYDSDDPKVKELFGSHGGYIGNETLSAEIKAERQAVDQADELELEKGCRVWLGVRK